MNHLLHADSNHKFYFPLCFLQQSRHLFQSGWKVTAHFIVAFIKVSNYRSAISAAGCIVSLNKVGFDVPEAAKVMVWVGRTGVDLSEPRCALLAAAGAEMRRDGGEAESRAAVYASGLGHSPL